MDRLLNSIPASDSSPRLRIVSQIGLRRVRVTAATLAAVAIVGSALLGYAVYRASRARILQGMQEGSMNLALSLGRYAELSGEETEAGFLRELERQWSVTQQRFAGRYLTVIGRDGTVRLHTRQPELIGRPNPNDPMQVLPSGEPLALYQMLQSKRDGSAEMHDAEGRLEFVSHAYHAAHDLYVGIHTPAEVIDADVRSAALPWAIGFAVLSLVILPTSIALLVWSAKTAQASLQTVGEDLVAAHAARLKSEEKARQAHARLLDAIESLADGFALYDADDRLIVCNERFREIYYSCAELLVPGTLFEDHLRLATARGQTADIQGREEEWIQQRLRQHRDPQGSYLQHLGDGRWILIHERKTQDGGIVGIRTDVTDRKRAEMDREEIIHELEQKNAELERFTYTVSHDLKSPLITIKGFVGLLTEDLDQENLEEVRRDLVEINGAADKMQRLLEELLQLSRIGRVNQPPEKIDMVEVAREAAGLVAGRLQESGGRITIDDDLPEVLGDRTRVLEVFQNLLDNALKFTRSGTSPEIDVGAREEMEDTVFFVKDRGMGIEPRFHQKVFGLFEQLNPSKAGTGIGLTIVKRIIETHGGRIWIESEGGGRGTTFCFTIPAAPAGTSSWSETKSCPPMPR